MPQMQEMAVPEDKRPPTKNLNMVKKIQFVEIMEQKVATISIENVVQNTNFRPNMSESGPEIGRIILFIHVYMIPYCIRGSVWVGHHIWV